MVTTNSLNNNKMPYALQKSGSKFYVITKKSNRRHSKKPLSKRMAIRQMRAIYASTRQNKLYGGDFPNHLYGSSEEMHEFLSLLVNDNNRNVVRDLASHDKQNGFEMNPFFVNIMKRMPLPSWIENNKNPLVKSKAQLLSALYIQVYKQTSDIF